MSADLALLGGQPTLTPADVPLAWPYWSEPRPLDAGSHFSAWPSEQISEVENWVRDLHEVTYAVYMNSGTSALWAAYFALGLAPGYEVLVPSNTFLATVTPLFQLNLVPVLCDSDPTTVCLDLRDAEARITDRTRAICVTHVWGAPADLAELYAWAELHDLHVVEDCSHAHGARSHGMPVGSRARVAAMSLGASKTVSGGVGGALFTSSQEAYERALLLGLPHARSKREVLLPEHAGLAVTGLGANLRGHPAAAALAGDHLRRFDNIVETKNANLLRLERAVESVPFLEAPPRPNHWTRGTRYGFKARARADADLSASTVVAALKAEGVPASVSPGPLLHRRPLFRDPSAITTYAPGRPTSEIGCDPDAYPVSDEIQHSMVSFDITVLHGEAGALLSGTEQALEKLTTHVDALRTWERRQCD